MRLSYVLEYGPPDPPSPVRYAEEPYTVEMLRRVLENYEHLRTLAESTSFLAHTSNLESCQETLWCLLMDVQQTLPKVPIRQRKALFLRFVVGLTEEEAATRLHISRMSLRERLQSGLVNMRKLLNS